MSSRRLNWTERKQQLTVGLPELFQARQPAPTEQPVFQRQVSERGQLSERVEPGHVWAEALQLKLAQPAQRAQRGKVGRPRPLVPAAAQPQLAQCGRQARDRLPAGHPAAEPRQRQRGQPSHHLLRGPTGELQTGERHFELQQALQRRVQAVALKAQTERLQSRRGPGGRQLPQTEADIQLFEIVAVADDHRGRAAEEPAVDGERAQVRELGHVLRERGAEARARVDLDCLEKLAAAARGLNRLDLLLN